MFQRVAFLGTILVLTLSLAFGGCGDDDSTGPGDTGPLPADFSGNWTFDLEVIARTVCDDEVGDTGTVPAVITQQGSSATIVFDEDEPIDLVVNGSTATGSSTGDEQFDVELTLADGEVTGEVTLTRTATPCTQVYAVVGTRTNSAPSPAFNGYWDIGLEILSSDCPGDVVGTTEDICLQISVSGNTVSINVDDGVIAGVGDGNTAVLTRIDGLNTVEVTLTVSGNTLTGTAVAYEAEDDCTLTESLTGTKRVTPCPPPAEAGDFAGSWDMLITVIQSGCADEEIGDSFGACMTATVDGTDITLNDGSSEGPFDGEIDGDTATLVRSGQEGVLTVQIEVDGDEVFGTATMSYFTGDCAGAIVVYSVAGSRRSEPCGSGSGGNFAGYWNISGQFVKNECGFTLEPTCSEVQQVGNTVFFVDDGFQGTADGNTMTAHLEETLGTTTFVLDIVITLSGDENSFTGTQTATLTDSENPLQSCETIANITGTRTSSCGLQRSQGSGHGFFREN